MLSSRLLEAASLVRCGSRVADIGTDHAYLPIFLIEKGVSPSCIAADLRRGPLAIAGRNIEKSILTAKIETVLSDGLSNIDENSYDDVVICGMGGETIISILDNAKIEDGEKRFVLQPQTSCYKLRSFLLENGFEILLERYCVDGDKLYNLMLVAFCGNKRKCTGIAYFISEAALLERPPLFEEYCRAVMGKLLKKRNGLSKSASVHAQDIFEIEKMMKQFEAATGFDY